MTYFRHNSIETKICIEVSKFEAIIVVYNKLYIKAGCLEGRRPFLLSVIDEMQFHDRRSHSQVFKCDLPHRMSSSIRLDMILNLSLDLLYYV